MIIWNALGKVNLYLNILYSYIYGYLCIVAYIFMDSHRCFQALRIIDVMLYKIVS